LDEHIKQRLVGAAVLLALAVIFLPALFDKDERVAIDTTSQIPPAPVAEVVDIPRPIKPEGIKVPPAEALFQPEVVENTKIEEALEAKESSEGAINEKVETITKTELKPEPKPEPKKVLAKPKPESKEPSQPRLSESGVPIGWVIQAASFKSSKSAEAFSDKLLKANYKSYFKSVKTEKGEYFRVFIGPYVDEQQAISVKRLIDKDYKVSSRVLRFNPISGN